MNKYYTEDFKYEDYVLLKMNTTMRYSATFSLIPESVASHSCQLGYLSLLYSTKYPKLFELLQLDIKELLIKSILHDVSHELIMGDIINPIKTINTDIKKAFDAIEDLCINKFTEYKPAEFKTMCSMSASNSLNTNNCFFFKLLDTFVVLIKSYNELKLNNYHYKRIAIEITQYLQDVIAKKLEALVDYAHKEELASFYTQEINPMIEKCKTIISTLNINQLGN